jgi:hypothetical protein
MTFQRNQGEKMAQGMAYLKQATEENHGEDA